MHDNLDCLQMKFLKRLRSNSGDHPQLKDAVAFARPALADLEWDGAGRVVRGIDRVANDIEDWLGSEGAPLEDEIAERWHGICRASAEKAKIECYNMSCQRL